jgi:anti-sigma regulatory factor (Ser/Thr protein kinase)
VNSTNREEKTGAQPASPQSEYLLQLQLESNPEALCLVRATLQCAAESLHFGEAETRAVVRAVDEALANVIRHSYGGKKGMPITVICNRVRKGHKAEEPAGLEIVLTDSGAPVDPAKLKGRALEEVRPGGLGLHFIKQSMDVVEFSRKDDKNLLRLVKYPASSKAEKKAEGE